MTGNDDTFGKTIHRGEAMHLFVKTRTYHLDSTPLLKLSLHSSFLVWQLEKVAIYFEVSAARSCSFNSSFNSRFSLTFNEGFLTLLEDIIHFSSKVHRTSKESWCYSFVLSIGGTWTKAKTENSFTTPICQVAIRNSKGEGGSHNAPSHSQG